MTAAEVIRMNNYSILEENFFLVEGQAISALKNANTILEECDCSQFNNISSTGELRLDPEYLNHRANIDPLGSASKACQLINSRISGDKDAFRNMDLDKATKITIIFSKLNPEWKLNNDTAIEDLVGFYGGPNGCSYDPSTKILKLSDSGVISFRNRLGEIRELASKLPTELNSMASLNDKAGVSDKLEKLALIKKLSDLYDDNTNIMDLENLGIVC